MADHILRILTPEQGDARYARKSDVGLGANTRVIVVTGEEERPESPFVMWIGGTDAPVNMAEGDLWFSTNVVVTNPDPDPDPDDPSQPQDPAELPQGAITGFATPPGTLSLATDGTPSITVAHGWYATGAAKQVVGARIFKPVGVTTSGTWTAHLFDSASGDPSLGAPVRSQAFATLKDGWNVALFPTPYTIEVGDQNTLWVGYGTSNGQYLNAASALPATEVPSSPAGIALAPSEFLAPTTSHRTLYRIGSGATEGLFQTPYSLVWYGVDLIVVP